MFNLSVKNLSFGYSTALAKHLSFDLPQSLLVCLLGPNGSGKSTLLKTLANLIKPMSGSISVKDIKIENASRNEIAKLAAFVKASSTPEIDINVFDFVALGRIPYTGIFNKLKENDLEFINHSMDLTQTKQFAKRKIHDLSDGERQRVAVARAIAQNTPLLLLDEPTAFLDYPNRIKLYKLLKTMCEKHRTTIILSTHEIDLAKRFADKILFLNGKGQATLAPPQETDFSIFEVD